jgi:imidazoleglycerol-phosphate dehydratase
MRTASIQRITNETKINLVLNLDGTRKINIDTGIQFFDHMLTLFSFHAGFDLTINSIGDLAVDDHHSVEDIGLALGEALKIALGDKKGINRYGLSYVPMDESLSRVVIDLSNRPFLVFKAKFDRHMIGNFSTENVFEFFKSFVNEAKINLHIENLYTNNTHHQIESMFKAFGRALRESVIIISKDIESTKGVL